MNGENSRHVFQRPMTCLDFCCFNPKAYNNVRCLDFGPNVEPVEVKGQITSICPRMSLFYHRFETNTTLMTSVIVKVKPWRDYKIHLRALTFHLTTNTFSPFLDPPPDPPTQRCRTLKEHLEERKKRIPVVFKSVSNLDAAQLQENRLCSFCGSGCQLSSANRHSFSPRRPSSKKTR